MKTPALLQILKPLRRLEVAAKHEYEAAQQEHAAREMVNDAKKKNGQKAVESTVKKSEADALELAKQLFSEVSSAPVRRRFEVNDPTVEKIGELLGQNPYGFLLFRDELRGFLKSLDKPGLENARGFYLEAWDGKGRYGYDRIMRGTLDIENCCLSILGGIQPGPLQEYVMGTLRGGGGDDGLIQRFQLTVWPDSNGEWRHVDRWPDTAIKNAAHQVFFDMAAMDAADLDPQQDDDGLPYLRFAPDAQSCFDDWRARLEQMIRQPDIHPAVESHFAKYRSLMPSLALLLHLAEFGGGSVPLPAAERAIAWCDYLQSHALRLYGAAVQPGFHAAHRLAERLLNHQVPSPFKARDVYRHCWSGLDEKTTKLAIEVLCDLDWLHESEMDTGGRRSFEYAINPGIFAHTLPSEPPKLPKAPSVSFVSPPPIESTDFSSPVTTDEWGQL